MARLVEWHDDHNWMQNVFDQDPPFVAGAFENNYDESLATIKGGLVRSVEEEILKGQSNRVV